MQKYQDHIGVHLTRAKLWNTEGMPSKYETDYYAWAMETAKALRAGRIEDVDLDAAAEEIEDLGKSERRSLHSAVVQLFLQLLKSKYQPNLATATV